MAERADLLAPRAAARAVPPTLELLDLYRHPGSAPRLPIARWPGVLGATRRSRTLGHLGLRLHQAGCVAELDPRVRQHLESVAAVIAHQRQQIRWELGELAYALRAVDTPLVLLKGAAYEVLGLPLAAARLPSDVDVLAPRERLAACEQALRAGGWKAKELNEYDERYYREWSHEIPPFTHPARGMELDVHHAITPSIKGGGVDVGRLLEGSVEVEWGGHRRFRVLGPVDQLLHVAIHTFTNSELDLRLREAMDFDLLFRHYAGGDAAGLSERLARRAVELGQSRPLWWALHFAVRWLETPVPPSVWSILPAPPSTSVRAMQWLADRSMLPGWRIERRGADRAAAIALLARYQWNRLPLTKLVPHVLEKSRRRLLQPPAEPDAP